MAIERIRVRQYAALANEYPQLTEALRAASAAEAAALTDSLERRARDLLAPPDHEMLARVAAWHTDHFYCLLLRCRPSTGPPSRSHAPSV